MTSDHDQDGDGAGGHRAPPRSGVEPRGALERRDEDEGRHVRDLFEGGLRELRVPVNAMLGWLGVLRARDLDAAAAANALAIIERHAEAQARLLDDLDRLLAIVGGEAQPVLRRADLASIVAEAVEDVRPAATARGITVRQVVDPGTATVRAAPDLLRPVLAYLVARTLTGTRRGGKVRVVVHHDATRAEVLIHDTGAAAAVGSSHPSDPLLDVSVVRTHQHLSRSVAEHLVALHGGTLTAAGRTGAEALAFALSLPLAEPSSVP